MSRVSSHLRLFDETQAGSVSPRPSFAEAAAIANRELIRPQNYRRGHHLEPFSHAWFDELEGRRFLRHGHWLNAALEFGRHPGESILLLHPGLGSDAVRYLKTGTEVTLATTEQDYPDLIRANLERYGLSAPMVHVAGWPLPFLDGQFDVVVLNGLHDPIEWDSLPEELFRILKVGGKVIGLFPARFDAGYWQDLLLPYQHLYWRRPADPVSGPRTTARELRRLFARYGDHKFFKRHLRRSELPHLFRALPLVILERLLGRILVLKAKKPISAARVLLPMQPSESMAA